MGKVIGGLLAWISTLTCLASASGPSQFLLTTSSSSSPTPLPHCSLHVLPPLPAQVLTPLLLKHLLVHCPPGCAPRLPLCSLVLWVSAFQKGWVWEAQSGSPFCKRWRRLSSLLRILEKFSANGYSTPNSQGTIFPTIGSQQASRSLLKETQYVKSCGVPASSSTHVLST